MYFFFFSYYFIYRCINLIVFFSLFCSILYIYVYILYFFFISFNFLYICLYLIVFFSIFIYMYKSCFFFFFIVFLKSCFALLFLLYFIVFFKHLNIVPSFNCILLIFYLDFVLSFLHILLYFFYFFKSFISRTLIMYNTVDVDVRLKTQGLFIYYPEADKKYDVYTVYADKTYITHIHSYLQ